jgi:transposase-like protein
MKRDEFVPQTLQEAILHFSDADVCLDFMVQLRWPNGVTCPACECEKVSFLKTRRIWKCSDCKKQFSVKLGTIFEDSPLGLQKWLPAFWMIANAKNGISSYEIHRALGVTQKTAWFMLQRIRAAMHTGTFEKKMSGEVEADETFIGGKARNMHKAERKEKIQGRGATGKEVVMGLLDRGERKDAEAKKKKIGKHSTVRIKHVKNTSAETLKSAVRENVEAGSILYTDAAHGYQGLDGEYVHGFIDHAIAYVDGTIYTNGLENFWTLLKRTLRGTYVSCNAEHLFRYLDEQAFRFNEREDNDAGRFLKVISNIEGRRLTYKQLTERLSA